MNLFWELCVTDWQNDYETEFIGASRPKHWSKNSQTDLKFGRDDVLNTFWKFTPGFIEIFIFGQDKISKGPRKEPCDTPQVISSYIQVLSKNQALYFGRMYTQDFTLNVTSSFE